MFTDKSKTLTALKKGRWAFGQATNSPCDHTVTQRKDDFVIVNLLQTLLQTLVSVTPLSSEILSSASLSWRQYRTVVKCTDTGIRLV